MSSTAPASILQGQGQWDQCRAQQDSTTRAKSSSPMFQLF